MVDKRKHTFFKTRGAGQKFLKRTREDRSPIFLSQKLPK